MRNRILLFCSLLGCFFSSLSQTRTPHTQQHIISPDSLRGFDERAFRLSAIQQGISGDELNVAIRHAQINHIIGTYYPDAYNPANYKIGPAQVFNAPCVNEGFESGTFAGWTTTQGTHTNSCAYPTATTALGAGPTLTVLNTPLVDPTTGAVIPNSPLGGSKVARLNDVSAGAKVIKIAQNFVVTNNNYLYDLAYYAVQNGPHGCCDQPYMFVRLRDCIGNLLSCPNFTFNAPATNSNICPGTGPTSWINTGIGCGGGQCVWRTNGWQKYSVDLTQYIGTCVTIEIIVGDCALGGHYLYTYFDSNCNTMNLTVNGTQTVSMPNQTVNVQVPCASTATLTAPSGLNPWTWNGPPLSGVTNNTNQTISTSVAGDYTLVMNPVGICNPIFRIVRLWFAPPATVVATPSNICGPGSSTLTASGATNYTWQPGGSNSPSIVVSPTSTSQYLVFANTGTCTGFFTVQVTVSPAATIGISATSTSVCANQSTTLTASGAQTYTWSPGGSNSPSIVVTPSVTTSYTVVGTTTTGCTATNSITINVVPTPTNFVTFASPSVICIGQSSNLFASALGASGYTWNPGGIVGNFVSVSPTVTTNYTVVASNGGCTNSAVQQVSVDPGPTMTVVASPTSICPGNSATLTATGAVAYTWNPGAMTGSAVAVSPTITTTYTVMGVTGLGCPGTATVTEVVNPVPGITITPASSSICAGTSGTLIASGASSYTWNPGGMVGATVVVSPTVNTTYTIIGSNGTCTSSVVKTLTVVPNPTVTASASTPSICSGQSAVLTGSGATTYTWNPGALTGSNVVVSPTVTTNYTVIGNTAGCSSSATVGLTVNYGPTLTANASPTNICAGGSATLSVSGGLSYTWNPGALTGSAVVVSPGVTTTYSVTGINGFGCTTTATVNLNVTPNPTVTASASSPSICIGTSATLTTNGATTYTWNPGALTGSNIVVSPTVNTTYTVTGTSLGCTGQTTITINVVPLPTVSAASSPTAICNGSSATLTANGATSYTWNPGALTGSNVVVSPTVNTTYTVTGSLVGCSSTSTVMLTVNYGPTLTANANPTIICAGSSATLTVSGGNSYTWNPGALTGSNIVVSPGVTTIYSVTGINGFSCTTTNTLNLTVTPIPTITPAAAPATICLGGSSTLTANGATTYTWNPGALTGSNIVVSPTVNTTYTVMGATAGCTGQNTITVSVLPNPTVTASSSPTAICNGSSATLTANGASTYTWNPGALTGSAVVVSPSTTTTYTVSGSNGGCTSNATVALIVNPIPTIMANASPTAVCITGNVTLTASGAATYTWNPGALTGSNVVVTPTVTTTYTVSGTSGAGCTGSVAITVTVNAVPLLTLAATPTAICNGQSSTLTVQGATSYTWNPGALTGSNVVVNPTVTTVYTVNASNGGCSTTGTLALIVNPVPTLTATANPTNICAGSSATLTGSGAVTYTWNPGALTGATVSVSPSVTTTYTLTGANVFNCTSTQTVNLVVTPLPTITANASPTAICIGGSSTLTATGAGSYTWNPGALTGSNVVVSPTATTIYTVTGANGNCTSTQTVNLIVNPLPTLTTGASPNPVCLGASVTMTVSGANTYTWNPGALTGSNVVVSPTVNTSYTVTGTSLAGCINTAVTNVTVNPLPTLSVTSSNTNICAGTSATLTGSGASTYTWNPGALTGSAVVVSPSVTTVYTLTATSALGCTNSITFTQAVTPNPTVIASASPTAICIGGSSTLTATGAASYTWNPGALTGSAVVVSPTITTTYSITGANGACTGNQTITVIVNPTPTLTVGGSPNPVCAGTPVTMTVSGASTYTWNPGALTGSNVVVTPTTSTSYSVAGTSVSGCTAATVLNVTVNPLPTLSVSSTNSNVCAGTSVTLTASGGVSYIWNPGGMPGSTIVVTPTATIVYTVSGTSGFGCLNTITFTQIASPIPTVVANASLSSICLGQSSNLTASGATSYTWNPGALTGSNIIVSPAVSTVYTVTGANGNCAGTTTVSVTVNPTPTITASATPSTICSGSSTTLTANGGSTYTWNPGGPGNNIVVTPTTTTSYTVTGTNGFGCTATAVANVTVNAVPSVSIASTATNICIGSSATFTGSGATSYTWNPGGTIGTTVAVSPTSTTVYTVTGSNGFCSSTSQFTLLVTPSPTVTASASNSVICSGNSVALTSNGATNYTWNPGALSGSNVVVSPTVTTSYTVTGSNGACTSSAVVSITVNSSPNLTVNASPTLICSGTTVTLTASGAVIYAWLPMAINGATVTDQPTVTTTYTVIGSNGTCTNAAFVTVSVNTTPTISVAASPTAVCFGNASTLTANGATNYTWQPGALTGSNIVVNPTVTTTYTITGTNGNCSGSATINIVVNPNPTISVNATPSVVCSGSTASLTANGAANYTWMPGALAGSLVTVNPTITTVYTVSASDVNGCTDMASITLSVNMGPMLTAAASPSSMCLGSSATMTVSGAVGYTWNPGALTGSNIVVNPTVTTTYTVSGIDPLGCTGTQTVQLVVLPSPTVTASGSPTALCSGNSATLTGSGALTYTWNPGALTGSVIVVNPTVTTSYTVNGSNGLCGSGSTVVTIVVNDPPANVTASVSGQISCASPSVNLFSSSTTTTVLYLWNGPGTYTAAAQSPTGIGIPGTYTVTVTNTNGGCTATTTVAVTTDSTIPTVTASVTGTITCANTSATLSATGSPTNAGYSWTGPAPFTSTAQTCTVSAGGSYTLTVTDLNNSCAASTVVTVVSDTNVPITATITPATCNGTVANNDAAITANGFGPADKYDFNVGATYTGSATYATATLIPVGGVLTNTLSNPLSPTPYTVRFFAANGCTKDTTLMLMPTTCITNKVFGIAKAVSTPTLKPDNTYDVIYSVVVANTGTVALNNIVLDENLSNTFPPPTTFSIASSPSIASMSSSLVLDGTFNGTVQTVMTNTLSSILPAGKVDTIVFMVNVKPNGIFGPYKNTVTGFASPTAGVVFGDSSETGFNPDPDLDGIPTNNNQQTILNLTPNLFFGLTKKATVSDKQPDNTYNIAYTVTVHNLGNDTLYNVMIKDSLFNNTVRLPATYTVTGAPVTSGSLAANSSFNGNSDVNLVIASQSKMAPGVLSTIQFTINITPDTVTVFSNRAVGRAIGSLSVAVSDTSNNGDDPDTNDNGVWNEPVDNMPTIITIPNTTFFIPNGFSPDGDNINDTWKISGLPSNNKLTVFNRWGNKVYQKSDYDNSWNGYPNVNGTLGNQKLPPGTYYYIIEFSDGTTKAMNGFVVLQY
jgi:gliding motility-associated-like protein